MIILLKSEYFLKNTSTAGFPDYSSARRYYEFNTDTMAVEVRETLQAPADPSNPQGEDYSRPASQPFYTVDGWSYFHDGKGGYTVAEATDPSPTEPVLGCTDPTADNYNPDATLGNAEENACAYSPRVFTEVKTVEVLPCADGVCLRWFNSLGGIDTWVFQGKVDRPFNTEAAGEFSQGNGLQGAASKSGQPTLTLRTANLDFNRYQALWELYTSPKVWIHHKDGATEEVYVQPASVPAMPLGRRSYDLTVEIVKAPLNTLRQ